MLKYTGNGAALMVDQVPARDLTDEEVTQFGEEMLLASGLYMPVLVVDKQTGGYTDAVWQENDGRETVGKSAGGVILTDKKAGK